MNATDKYIYQVMYGYATSCRKLSRYKTARGAVRGMSRVAERVLKSPWFEYTPGDPALGCWRDKTGRAVWCHVLGTVIV